MTWPLLAFALASTVAIRPLTRFQFPYMTAWCIGFSAYICLAAFELGADIGQMLVLVALIGLTSLLVCYDTYQSEQSMRRTFVGDKLLKIERDRTEELLLNILPATIADRLRSGEDSIAEGYAETTVLFADIVGFTDISQRITPTRLVRLLNELFSVFDDLADLHGLEKIKTIGDAYMVAAGLPEHRDDHAEAIADMALDMRQALGDFQQAVGKPLQIRVGINSGPLVAGVIGKKKFIYDLWGDSVNLAARMESHGVPGEIQVTEATYHLLRDHFDLESRGDVEIKGKGEMPVWLVKGRSQRVEG